MTESQPPNRPAIHDSDTELIQAVNSGHVDLLPKLVQRYELRLYSALSTLPRDPA